MRARIVYYHIPVSKKVHKEVKRRALEKDMTMGDYIRELLGWEKEEKPKK